MNVMWLVGGAAAVTGGLLLHGPFHADGGVEYARPAAQAYELLHDMPVPDPVEAMLVHVPGARTDRELAPGRVTWRFSVGGTEVASFTTTVKPNGDGSVVTTALNMTGDAERLLRSKGDASTTPRSFADIAGAVMAEQVDAKLDGRPFDDEVVQRATARYVRNNMGDMMQSAAAAMEVSDEQRREWAEQDAAHDRRVAEAKQKLDEPFKPGEPMVNP